MKRMLGLVLAIVLLFGSMACTRQELPVNSELTTASPAQPSASPQPESSKTQTLLQRLSVANQYEMTVETTISSMSLVVRHAVMGSDTYTEIQSPMGTSIAITKNGIAYLLDPASKTYMQTSVTDDITGELKALFTYDASNLPPVVKGEETVESKTYDAETFAFADRSVKYLFEGGELRYILSPDTSDCQLVKITSLVWSANAGLFEIPDDYTKIELP